MFYTCSAHHIIWSTLGITGFSHNISLWNLQTWLNMTLSHFKVKNPINLFSKSVWNMKIKELENKVRSTNSMRHLDKWTAANGNKVQSHCTIMYYIIRPARVYIHHHRVTRRLYPWGKNFKNFKNIKNIKNFKNFKNLTNLTNLTNFQNFTKTKKIKQLKNKKCKLLQKCLNFKKF